MFAGRVRKMSDYRISKTVRLLWHCARHSDHIATITTDIPFGDHPRFVSYHHLLGFFPRSPLLWGGLSPTVAAHGDPSEILSGLKAPLNQPVWAVDARSHHPLVNTRPLSWNRNA